MNRIDLNDLQFKDGKYVYTFTPKQDMTSLTLVSDCIGDLEMDHIQIERNPSATYFVPPEVYEGNLSGIFKHLKEINLELTDTEKSTLWGKIRLNNQGMLREYHRDHITTEIAETAGGIRQRITDLDKRLKVEIANTAQGFTVRLENLDKKVTGQVATTARTLTSQFSDEVSGLSSRIDQNASAISREVRDRQGAVSQVIQTANGISSRVSALDQSVSSEFVQLRGLINQRVTRGDVEGIIRNSGDSIYLTIKDKIPQMDGKAIKNAIAIDRSGTRISGNHLSITADTYIQNGVIKNAHIGDLSASKITTGTLNAGNVRIINLDVNQLTGNKFTFLAGAFQSPLSKVRLTGNGMDVLRNDSSYSTRFNDNGIEIWRGGQHVGSVHSLNATDTRAPYVGLKSMSLTTQPNAYLSLSYYSIENGTFYRALSLGGDGRLRLHAPFYYENTNSGFKLEETTISNREASAWIDVESGGGILISRDKDTWLSLSNGYWFSITDLYNRIKAVESHVRSLSTSSGGGTYTPPTYTPPAPPPKSTGIKVGDRVKFYSGQTTYYDHNNYPVTIPTNKYGRNYRTLTYTVSNVDNTRDSKYRLNYDGVIIAWARPGQVYKV